jgi:hypothetical protein
VNIAAAKGEHRNEVIHVKSAKETGEAFEEKQFENGKI